MRRLKKGSKILIANDSVGLTGVQVAVTNISSQMKKLGYQVVRMEPTDKDFLVVSTPVDKQFNWTIFATPVIAQRILKEKPDAIFISTVEAPIGGATKNVCEFLEISKLCFECPYTLSYTTHLGLYISKTLDKTIFKDFPNRGFKIKDMGDKLIDYSEERYLRGRYLGAKRVIVNSQSSKEKLDSMGIENIVVVPRGIDLEKFRTPISEDINPYLKYDWYQEDPKPILLYLGRVAYEKDIHLFLKGHYPQYHRVVAGEGPALESLRKDYGNSECVHFVGAVAREEVPNFFRFARLSFFPSSFDTFGITIIESAACGTPVIGFDVGGPKDVIKKGVMGVIVSKDDDIMSGLKDALKINRRGCSKYTRKNFSWEKSTNIILDNLYPIKWGKTLA